MHVWTNDPRHHLIFVWETLPAYRRLMAMAEAARATPVPATTDAELALVARIGQRDPERAEALRTGIASLRTELTEQAQQIGDPRLTRKLADRAAAAVGYDADTHTLPDPDEDGVATAAATLTERIALITDELSTAGATVPVEVILLSAADQHPLLEALLPPPDPAPGDASATSGTATSVRLPDPEVELVDRLFARDIDAQSTATTLLARLYWQRETLRQTVGDEARWIAPPQPVKTYNKLGTAAGGYRLDIPAFIVSRVHLEALTASIEIAHASVTQYQAARAEAWISEPDAPAQSTIIDRLLLPVTPIVNVTRYGFNALVRLFD